MSESDPRASTESYDGWQVAVRKYQRPRLSASVWQIVNSYGGFILVVGAMVATLGVGAWLTLLLAIPAAGFLVRIFIIQHDCGHGSFFRSRRANDAVGIVSGVLTMTPYQYWRKTHAIHHAHHAELEERGIGDVWTLTVDEYLEAPRWKRALYRGFRNPIFLFILAPAFNFVVMQRIRGGIQATWNTGERASVWWTNLALAGLFAASTAAIGLGSTMLIVLPIIGLAASVGTWLFYVQHQFERTYWEHTPEWDYTLAAMHGSSYYRLPRVLQWFTGNIGFHHIHHLSPRIPNYELQRAHDENPMLQRVVQLTLGKSLRTVMLALWDEKERRLVSFRTGLRSRRA